MVVRSKDQGTPYYTVLKEPKTWARDRNFLLTLSGVLLWFLPFTKEATLNCYKEHLRTSLVAQWMGIHLPKPATRAPSPFREDCTYAEQLSPCTTTELAL